MKITIDEEKFSDLCNKARDIYINNLKKTAEEKGEKMPKLIEVSEAISMIIFCSELRKVIFNSDNVVYCDTDSIKVKNDSIPVRLNIPKEFIEHYNKDKFKESLERIIFDMSRLMKRQFSYNPGISGKYEIETLKMLIDVFSDSEIVR